MMERRDRSNAVAAGSRRTWLAGLGLGLGYALLADLGLRFSAVEGAVTPISPAAGLAVAGLLLGGLRLWPAIVLGRLLAFWVDGRSEPAWMQLAVSLGAAGSAVVAAWGLRRLGGIDLSLRRLRDVLWLIGWGAMAAPVIGATVGVASAAVALGRSWHAIGVDWFNWWAGSATGVLVVAPLVLAWFRGGPRWRAWQWLHLVGVVAVATALAYVIFLPDGPPSVRTWLVFPAVAWAALALGVRGASVATVPVAALAVWGTSGGGGPLDAGASEGLRLLVLQQFIAVVAATGLVLAAVAESLNQKEALRSAESARDRSEQRYQALFDSLDDGFCVIELLFDGAGDPVDYRFVEVNAAFERETGLKDAVGRRMLDLVPDLEPHWAQTYGRVATTGEAARFENYAEPMDRWFEVHALRVGAPAERRVAVLFKNITARKRAEADLARARERLEAGLEAGEVATWIWLIPEDKVLADRNLARMFGVGDADAAGGPLSAYTDAIHPDDRDRVGDTIGRALEGDGQAYEAEYRIAAAGRPERWVVARGRIERDAEGRALRLTGVVLDITERRQAIAQLRESEDLVRTIAENSTQGLAMMDGRGYCTYANRAWLAMTGFDADEIRSKPLHYLVHHHYPDGRPYPMEDCPIDRALPENFDVRAHEDLFFRKDGSSFPVLCAASPVFEDGRPVSTVIEIRDVTAAKEFDETLRRREAQFRQLADAMPQIVWAASPDGRVDYYNQRWYEYTGRPPVTEGGDEDWSDLVPEPDHSRILSVWAECIRTGEPYDLEYRIKRATDGMFRWHLGRALPVKDADGVVTRWYGTNTDIHEHKQLQEQNDALLSGERRAREAAEHAGQLKDEFLATLSHELRTPLNAILGWTQLLRHESGLPDEVAEGLDVIARNARTQAQLVEDLLDMSRIVSGKLRLDVRRLDLAEVVKAAVYAVAPAAEGKGVRLVPVIDPHVGPVRGDAARLQQVIWNLLSNAVKFTPRGGKVQVALERVNSHVEVTVADSGAGIAPQFLPHVFERFRQADAASTREHGGLGLGLAIVKSLVEAHGGQVRAKSPGEGQGATFSVELPLMPVHDDTAETPSSPRRHPRHSPDAGDVSDAEAVCEDRVLAGVRVLVVDDEADARELVRRVLGQCHAEVTTASNMADALVAITRDRPDVLLSDVGMAGQDGYALIRAVRALPDAEGGRTPAAALTAFARSEDRRRALAAGYQMHVAKPAEPEELVMVVASLAGRFDGGRLDAGDGSGGAAGGAGR